MFNDPYIPEDIFQNDWDLCKNYGMGLPTDISRHFLSDNRIRRFRHAKSVTRNETKGNEMDGDYTVELDEEQFYEIDNLVRIVISEFVEWDSFMEWEELYQEGWEKALYVIERYGVSYPAIRVSVTNRCIDLQRYYDRRKSQIPCTFIEPSDDEQLPEKSIELEAWSAHTMTDDDCLNNEFIDEMAKLFDDGSNEQLFVKLCAIYTNSRDGSYKVQDTLFNFDRSMEIEISKLLGYRSSSDRKYRNMKNNVRSKIRSYMGWNTMECRIA